MAAQTAKPVENGTPLKKAGVALALVGAALFLLSPLYVHVMAHQKAVAYLAAHPEMEFMKVVLGTGGDKGHDYSLYEYGYRGTFTKMANHQIVEMSDHSVYEAGPIITSGNPPKDAEALSGGYLSDFTRIPLLALITSLALVICGIALRLRTGVRP